MSNEPIKKAKYTKIDKFDGVYRFLSNFHPCTIKFEGKEYWTVEHAYQAAKTLDNKQREWVQQASSPGLAKRRGRRVDIRQDWDKIKIQIMMKLVLNKFQNPKLRDRLLATGDAELVEGNSWGDTFWGVSRGRGKNYLGRILMQVRQHLKKGRR